MIRRRKPRYYKGEFRDVFSLIFTGQTAKGQDIALFENKFAEYVGTKFAVSTCSGRDALSLILDALKLERGDEVIMPAYTLKDLVDLVIAKGLVPKLVDVEKKSFNMDPQLISAHITPKSRVIIATHLFGVPCDMEKITSIAKKYGMAVIEDCAHALGATIDGKHVGSIGDAAFFSFETIKGINTFGGGMATTNNESIIKHIKSALESYPYKSYGILTKILFSYAEDLLMNSPAYPVLIRFLAGKKTSGIISRFYLSTRRSARAKKSRFTNLQAFLGLRQLGDLEYKNKLRNNAADRLIKRLGDNISFQDISVQGDRIFYFFVIRLSSYNGAIEDIRRKLVKRGIDSGVKGEITDNCALYLNLEEEYPVVKGVYESSIQLPLYDDMTDREATIIADALSEALT
ncbi:MAG: aminotransferase class I/II-fold pyridoxal phosphate-dependent enzyme [Candidatus Omnitrophota bacterium]